MAFGAKSSNALAIASRLKTPPIVPLPELRCALRPVSPFHSAVRQDQSSRTIFGGIVACLLIALEVLCYFHRWPF
jgi:hypothetical protein